MTSVGIRRRKGHREGGVVIAQRLKPSKEMALGKKREIKKGGKAVVTVTTDQRGTEKKPKNLELILKKMEEGRVRG